MTETWEVGIIPGLRHRMAQQSNAQHGTMKSRKNFSAIHFFVIVFLKS